MKNKKTLVALGVLGVAVLVCGTFAFFSNSVNFENLFKLSVYKTEAMETFESPNNWKPCDETEKSVVVKNLSTMDVAVRVKYEEYWLDKNGQSLPLERDGMRLATVELQNQADWTLRDGWYYYKTNLAENQTTSEFMKSVKLNCDANFTGEINYSADGLSGETGSDPYERARFHVNVTVQTIQANAASEWNS